MKNIYLKCVLPLLFTFPLISAEPVKIMDGFPPTAKSQVTDSNWITPPYNRWAFRNLSIKPAVMVPRAGSIYEIPKKINAKIENIEFSYKGKKYTVLEALKGDYTDGYIVIKNGTIMYERYFDGFEEHDHHLWASNTKSLISMTAGILVKQGKLDVSKKVAFYLPELKESVFGNLSVQELLNMVTAIDYTEDYEHFKPGTVSYEYYKRLSFVPAPDLVALDPTKSDIPKGIQGILHNFKPSKTHKPSEVFEYQSPNVEVIGWIIERQSGMPLQKFISKNIWQKLQTEHDALMGTDFAYTPIASGGFSSSLRDFARFGLAILNDGKLGKEQIFPKVWVDAITDVSEEDILHMNRSIYKKKGTPSYDEKLLAYKNFWWVHDKKRKIFTGRGVFGQILYIDKSRDVVIATFSSAPTASNASRKTQQVKMEASKVITESLQ